MKKKHTTQSGSFSLQLVLCSAAVCSMITGTLLAFFHSEASAGCSDDTWTSTSITNAPMAECSPP